MELVSFRRALASLMFACHGLLWLVNFLLGPPEFKTVTMGMVLVYMVGYFAVSAGWFWGRWFGLGLCYFGAVYLLGMFQSPEYATLFAMLGGSHVLALLCLYGSTMASCFEGAPEWRLTFNVDEDSARRLGRSVQSAATTLPILILQLFGPRPESSALVLLAAGLAIAGFFGLLRMRTWALLALASAGLALGGTMWLPAELSVGPMIDAVHPSFSRSLLTIGTLGLFLPLLVWARPFSRSLRK